MSRIQGGPFINFQGRAREAMEFYHQVLGGRLHEHSRLEAEGLVIVASDGHPDYPAKLGDSMGIALSGTDQGRLTGIFNGLAEGGRIQMPLTRQPGGAEVGWLADQFGIPWTIRIEPV